MSTLRTYPLNNATILRLNSERDDINVSPEYQRQGGVWNREKKQLLIDSILNDYDIPKLYFHVLTPQQKRDSGFNYSYAIIDGRQRIEAIWQFIDGLFQLSSDFIYQADDSVNAKNLSYSDLAQEYPKIKIRFDSYVLPIVLVETEDIELIEDMFSRLNEAVPLNGAEKRNALGGVMAKAIRDTANDTFFTKIRIGNNRYQHREIAARLLFMEYINIISPGKITDTKKPYLDRMVQDLHDNNILTNQIVSVVVNVLNEMSKVFNTSDPLLKSQATIPVYYLVFREAKSRSMLQQISRKRLLEFNEILVENKLIAAKDITEANFEYLEFDRLNQQGTNDAYNIKERTRILSEFLKI